MKEKNVGLKAKVPDRFSPDFLQPSPLRGRALQSNGKASQQKGRMSSRGQTSIELLVVAMAVIMATTIFATMLNPELDSTRAIAIAKSELVRQLNAKDDAAYLISSIEATDPILRPDLELTIRTNPDSLAAGDIDPAPITSKIQAETGFTGTIAIQINPP